MNFFVKYFCKSVPAGVVIFCIQVDNDVLYRVIANQPPHAIVFLYLSDFLSFHTLNNEIFRQRFLCKTVQARVIWSYLVCWKIMMYCIVG